MQMNYQPEMKDLDEAVISALELFSRDKLPKLELPDFRRPLVVGSVNAAATGKILFQDKDAVFSDVSNYKQILDSAKGVDGAILVSASGAKSAPIIAKDLMKRKLPTVLITNNPDAPAGKIVEKTYVLPKQSEPYTYNASTYLGMVLANTQEDPKRILAHIRKLKIPQNLGDYDAFFLIVPDKFTLVREMLTTKFDELFGPYVSGRSFTMMQAKHGKTVVESDKELFISFGEKNKIFGTRRLDIPLPKDAGYGAMIAIGYYVVGHIQKQHPPYFRDSIESYCRKASKIFGEKIEPVVY
jgi:hypothetical protein